MEDVKKYIKSLKKAGLYKARLEDGNKEIIFSDDTFEVKTLPVKPGSFDGTEEMAAIDIEKEKEIARKTEARRLTPPPKEELVAEEPDSYRVSASKKLFWVAAFFIIVIAVAAGIYLLNQSGKIKLDIDPQDNPEQVTQNETGDDKTTGSQDLKPAADIKDDEVTGDRQVGETGTGEGDQVTGKPQEGGQADRPAAGEGDETGDQLTGETKDPGVKVEDAQKLPAATAKPVVEPKKETTEPKQQDIKPVTPAIQNVKIIKLPASLIRGYNDTLSRIVIPLVPVRIKVSGYLNAKIAIDERGKASARILSSEELVVTPESDRKKMVNRIIKRISGLKFKPPKDKRGRSVRVSEFNIDYQVGKLKTRLILKKR